jgi:hypothetical protein
MAMQTSLMSTLVLTNLQAIPSSMSRQFVTKHARWIAMPAALIGPRCVCTMGALIVAVESEFGPRVSRLAWCSMGAVVTTCGVAMATMLHGNHLLRRQAMRAARQGPGGIVIPRGAPTGGSPGGSRTRHFPSVEGKIGLRQPVLAHSGNRLREPSLGSIEGDALVPQERVLKERE